MATRGPLAFLMIGFAVAMPLTAQQTIEQRVQQLEKRLDDLSRQMSDVRKEIDSLKAPTAVEDLTKVETVQLQPAPPSATAATSEHSKCSRPRRHQAVFNLLFRSST